MTADRWRRALRDGPKAAVYRMGFGRQYLNSWWIRRARRVSPWTSWNYAHEAVFIHVPKTAGMSIYKTFGIELPPETHCPVAGYQTADPQAWQRAYTFAFVRNPWDRLVSAFHYLTRQPISGDDKRYAAETLGGFEDFGQFAEALSRPAFRAKILMWRHFAPQWFFVTDVRGRLAVEHLARQERFDEEVTRIGRRLGLNAQPARENAVQRDPYHVFYTPRTRTLVGEMYARDVALFEYAFGKE